MMNGTDGAAPVLTQSLTKRFGEQTAVGDLNLRVPSQAIVGLIGPSGCGKTTAVRLMTGAYEPTSGHALLFGKDPTELSSLERRRVGYLPQQPILFDNLTLWENLNYSASLYGMPMRRRGRLRDVLELTELSGHERKRVEQVSGGMKRRLALAATLAHDPEVLFLDEPTAGIDPILRRKFWDRFRELRDTGRTFVITTQYVGEAVYCDLVGVLSDGRLIAFETPHDLRRLACGGDLVDIVTTAPVAMEALNGMTALPFVRGPATRTGERELRVPVDDAGPALAALTDWAEQHAVDLESMTEHQPDYDDVFVRLIERDRARRGADEADKDAA
jgi:ABC-2 type transport system ATP-binding protein